MVSRDWEFQLYFVCKWGSVEHVKDTRFGKNVLAAACKLAWKGIRPARTSLQKSSEDVMGMACREAAGWGAKEEGWTGPGLIRLDVGEGEAGRIPEYLLGLHTVCGDLENVERPAGLAKV